jgi:hypothetical protein
VNLDERCMPGVALSARRAGGTRVASRMPSFWKLAKVLGLNVILIVPRLAIKGAAACAVAAANAELVSAYTRSGTSSAMLRDSVHRHSSVAYGARRV